MNICFLFGKINSKINFDFLLNQEQHISIASCFILSEDGNEIKLIAFDELADMLYSSYDLGTYIILEGSIINNCIEVMRIYEY